MAQTGWFIYARRRDSQTEFATFVVQCEFPLEAIKLLRSRKFYPWMGDDWILRPVKVAILEGNVAKGVAK